MSTLTDRRRNPLWERTCFNLVKIIWPNLVEDPLTRGESWVPGDLESEEILRREIPGWFEVEQELGLALTRLTTDGGTLHYLNVENLSVAGAANLAGAWAGYLTGLPSLPTATPGQIRSI